MQVDRTRRHLSGGRPRLVVDQAQAGLPHGAGGHGRSRRRRCVRRTGPAAGHVRCGAAGGVRPGRGALPDGRPVRHRVLRRRAGRIAGKLAPLIRTERPARVDSRVPADVWFEPSLVLEVLVAELTLSPNHTAGWGPAQGRCAGSRCGFPGSPAAGVTTRNLRTPRPRSSSSSFIALHAGRPPSREVTALAGCGASRSDQPDAQGHSLTPQRTPSQ